MEPTSESHQPTVIPPVAPTGPVSDDPPMPPAVTFQSGAKLLIQLGIVDHITHQGIRYIAETDPDWPFGDGRPHPYWDLANAKVMATDPFLKFFQDRQVQADGES